MTRLESILSGGQNVRHLEDVKELQEAIPELTSLPVTVVEMLYGDWSEDMWCASWHVLSKSIIKEFRSYLLEEI